MLSVCHSHKNGGEYGKGGFIGQTTPSGQTNRGELLSCHNRCLHRLIVHAAGLAPGICPNGDTMTGGVWVSERILQSNHL